MLFHRKDYGKWLIFSVANALNATAAIKKLIKQEAERSFYNRSLKCKAWTACLPSYCGVVGSIWVLVDVEEAIIFNTNQNDNVESDIKAKEYSVMKPDQMSCTTCILMSQALKVKLKSLQWEHMIVQVLSLCSTLDGLAEPCANIVFNYFDDIFEFVMDQLHSKEICTSSGICAVDALELFETVLPPRKMDGFYCTECKSIVTHVQESLKRNMSDAKFKEILQDKCKLTFRFKTECRSFINQYYHEIYSIVKRNLNSDRICVLVGVCYKARGQQDIQLNFSSRLEESIHNLNHESFQSIENMMLPQCLVCKSVFRVVKKTITKRMSNEKVKNAMHHACGKLGKVANKCNNFINKHGDQIIRFARNPKIFCVMIGMCTPIGCLREYETISKQNNINASEVKVSPNCNFCENVIQTLQKLFNQTYDIKSVLDTVCFVLSNQDLKYKCTIMLKLHKHLIIDLVTKNVAHQQICRAINMCLLHDNENKVMQLEDTFVDSNDDLNSKGKPKCVICKAMITTLKHMVPNGGSDKIKNALSHVCQKLKKGQQICQDIVNNHAVQIVELITKHASSRTICRMIGICPGTSQHDDESIDCEDVVTDIQISDGELKKSQELVRDFEFNKKLEGLQFEDPNQGPFCIICELMVTRFKLLLETKENRNRIVQNMLFGCDLLPSFFRQSCHNIILSYGNAVLDILSKITPHELCHFIGFRLAQANW